MACKSEADRRELLALHESELEDETIYVTKIEKSMKGEQIIHFVSEGLKDQDDLARLESTLGVLENSSKVAVAENSKQKGGGQPVQPPSPQASQPS